MPNPPCPVCYEIMDDGWKPLNNGTNVVCPRCGNFSIARIAERMMDPRSSTKLGPKGSRERANLSGWLRQRTTKGVLDSNFLNEPLDDLGREFWSIKPPSVKERADKLLLFVGDETTFAGQKIDWKVKRSLEFQARAWALNEKELLFLLNYLESEKLIHQDKFVLPQNGRVARDPFSSITVSLKGWEVIGKLREKLGHGNQGFVAMWFDNSMDEFYKMGVAPAIADAGYSPFKINDKEHVNKIDDEIVNEIRRSRFVVADFTGHRGGVYFEAGYAMGLGIPVIWCCSKEAIDDLHFDIRQYNCLDWELDKLDVFAKRLKDRIISVCGERTVAV